MKATTQMKLLHIRSWAMLWAALFLLVVFVAGGLLGFVKIIHASESTAFCGSTCHVMKPERVAHSNSPHAKVNCGTCHIGPGVAYMARAKMESMRETFNYITGRFPRPIDTPIKRLRPARLICEQCHWPQKYYGDKRVTKLQFTPDKKNSPQWFDLTIRTGGQDNPGRKGHGIHWHIDQELDYAASDAKRQVIPWVRVKYGEEETIYRSREAKDADLLAADKANVRRMDCLDCHNRAAHRMVPPEDLLDEALGGGVLPKDLPWLKREASKILDRIYPNEEEISRATEEIVDFYRQNEPAVYARRKDEVEALPGKLKEIAHRTQFPEMRANWKTHSDNIGHTRGGNGCFRCHDGKHVSDSGKVISQDCNLCHSSMTLGQGALPSPEPLKSERRGVKHSSLPCQECHGGSPNAGQTGVKMMWPKAENCGKCHDLKKHRPENGAMNSLACGECHRLHVESMAAPKCADCHIGAGKKGAHSLHTSMGLLCTQCHAKHAFKPTESTFRNLCVTCHEGSHLQDLMAKFLKERPPG